MSMSSSLNIVTLMEDWCCPIIKWVTRVNLICRGRSYSYTYRLFSRFWFRYVGKLLDNEIVWRCRFLKEDRTSNWSTLSDGILMSKVRNCCSFKPVELISLQESQISAEVYVFLSMSSHLFSDPWCWCFNSPSKWLDYPCPLILNEKVFWLLSTQYDESMKLFYHILLVLDTVTFMTLP